MSTIIIQEKFFQVALKVSKECVVKPPNVARLEYDKPKPPRLKTGN